MTTATTSRNDHLPVWVTVAILSGIVLLPPTGLAVSLGLAATIPERRRLFLCLAAVWAVLSIILFGFLF